ncbi:MAG: hypothetical protein C5B50_13285 [Verrucomicrobia bacterium]|nr:MAG: hypothetical protein C5B50_13285 [Verrucomicrobiota bacterium]
MPKVSDQELNRPTGFPWQHYILAFTVVLGITLPALLIKPLIGYRSIALIYLLGVVVTALFVGRGPTLLAAAASALFWDFFFLEPVPNLRIANAEDAIMFGTYFVVALVLGQLTNRIRAQQVAEHRLERRSTALYQLTRGLAEAASLDQMLQAVVQELERAFDAQIAVLLANSSGQLTYHPHASSTYDITGPEQPVAAWAFEHGQPAGRFTAQQGDVDAMFVPLLAADRAVGVIALRFKSAAPTHEQQNLLAAFAQHIALALDRQRLVAQAEQAKLLAESERLAKALLDSMSHEIRTPLAAIRTAMGNLAGIHDPKLSAEQDAMLAEIHEATERLNQLVGNVLDVTRLESGSVKPQLSLCDIQDLVHVALKDARSKLARHKLTVEIAPDLPLVRADYALLQQAFSNLLLNAASHTPPGTAVQVSARASNGSLLLTVADRGPGIAPTSIPRVFDKFYRAPNAPTGGTGLGLCLAKGFVEAHRGHISAENRPGGGALFTIRLPLKVAE